MDTFTEDYLNYGEILPKFEGNFADFDFSTASPTSDSIIYQHYYSPSSNDPYPPGDQQLAYNMPDQKATEQQDAYPQRRVSARRTQQPKAATELQAHFEETEKNDRVLKRKIAKERTKTKKGVTPIFKDIDSKYVPEGYDDPDLDENTKKRMTQMIRNRISAQNSRDRKKNYINQLEDINQNLREEITMLTQEKTMMADKLRGFEEREALLLQENESLRRNGTCSTCRGQQSVAIGEYEQVQQDEPLQTSGDNFIGGFSNLSSPILNRFPSGGRGLYTFFTFAAVLSLVAVMNVQQGTPGTILLSPEPMKNTRILELDEMNIISPIEQLTFKLRDLPYNSAQILLNIKPLRKHFDMNYDFTFQEHMETIAIYENNKEMKDLHLVPEYEYQNAIAAYQSPQSSLRRGTPTIMAQTRPTASQIPLEDTLSSTLFCPAGIEFYDSTTQVAEVGIKSKLNLEQADYLQLLVPKNSIARFDMKNNMTDMYGFSIQPNESNDTGMLEVWCKVFSIRELRSD